MSKHDSIKSADKKFRIDLNDFFVPVIVMVVLCILVVATFHDKEPEIQLAAVADTEQADTPSTGTTALNSIHMKASEAADATIRTMDAAVISDQAITRDQAAAAEAVDVWDTADADVISTAQTSTMAGIDESVANPANSSASTDKKADDKIAPYSADAAYGEARSDAPSADRHEAQLPRQDQWHKLHLEARQAQQAHMMKMFEYRARVEKRIEQDRRDLHRHRHNNVQQRREHRDRYRDKLEQAGNRTEDLPI